MAKYIDVESLVVGYSGHTPDDDFSKGVDFVLDLLDSKPPADVQPVAEIDEAVDEAIRILNAINSRGNMDYADYCEMHDVISAISPNCGADSSGPVVCMETRSGLI